MERERVGVLVVRVWHEDGSTHFRARIVSRLDVDVDQQVVRHVGRPAEVSGIVQAWVDEFCS
ncbi:MAG TPA: hypothetical protein VNT56_06910 [Acidimicrobiales bacterium]|nr:hypothetical protein [Acidimicrobiales bacterium]